MYHSTLSLRVIEKKKQKVWGLERTCARDDSDNPDAVRIFEVLFHNPVAGGVIVAHARGVDERRAALQHLPVERT